MTDLMPLAEFEVWMRDHFDERILRGEVLPPRPKKVFAEVSTVQPRGSKWTTYTPAWRDTGRVAQPKVSRKPGCYAIYADGTLVYLGMTDRIAMRVAAHLYRHGAAIVRALGRPVKTWAVKYRPERFYGERATLELRLIRRLRPVLNRRGNEAWDKRDLPPVTQNNYRVKSA